MTACGPPSPSGARVLLLRGLSPRPVNTQANFKSCSTQKRMSAKADFIGARYCTCELVFCAENLQKSEMFFEKVGAASIGRTQLGIADAGRGAHNGFALMVIPGLRAYHQ
jgi:hypothetical protein